MGSEVHVLACNRDPEGLLLDDSEEQPFLGCHSCAQSNTLLFKNHVTEPLLRPGNGATRKEAQINFSSLKRFLSKVPLASAKVSSSPRV